jgi:two-component system CheB/CheR fusion protein
MKVRLQEALARVEALVRQRDDLMHGQEVSSELSTCREIAASRVAGLTSRQRQIMQLVLDGHPSKNISADLRISIRTVESHRAKIMKRTGARSLPELARLAVAAAWTLDDQPIVRPFARSAPHVPWNGANEQRDEEFRAAGLQRPCKSRHLTD